MFYPLISAFEEDFNFVSWDYCGLFDSDVPNNKHRVSIEEHAKDALEVLNFYGFK